MDLRLNGKLALVTGSTAGIGYAIAESLLREGARVIVNGRTRSRVDEAIAKLEAMGHSNVLGLAADLGVATGTNEAIQRYPDVDILINNLGIFEPKSFEAISDSDWLRFFEVNVMSGVRLSRHHLPRMRAIGWGRIVFLSSESAVQDSLGDDSLRDDQDCAACDISWSGRDDCRHGRDGERYSTGPNSFRRC